MTTGQRLSVARERVGWSAVVGAACGSASALFLAALDRVTAWREATPLLVFALPLAGLAIGAVYDRIGRSVATGTNLVIDTIHAGGPPLPRRMAPLVLVGTLLTHLFGGSAGREGTAIQMGASLADTIARGRGITGPLRRHLLLAGVAGGFGSVFGTPWAGTVFALEFVVIGRWQRDAILPALVAAFVGDLTCRTWGIEHTSYPAIATAPLSLALLGSWLAVGAAVAATAAAFIEGTRTLKAIGTRLLPLPLRMAVGGALVVIGWQWSSTNRYLGLGIPTIVQAFVDPTIPALAFLAKLGFTAVTIASGFLGGEVTPLFFVGATLGNVLARYLALPLGLAAAVGMAAVFGSAANTPIALTVMAVELFGWAVLPHVAVVSTVAYLFTGHRSLYGSQRLGRRKTGQPVQRPAPAADQRH